ncbi:efflux RND transporter periplasmic adaptor subunit [Pseudomonas sp. F1_0610]|uniref:efflux RND transporter periplasmic adaptor subunit n=1 Tax=Pseudomonas sp. F1_0610 TaxID=3114284 RepID=UPI0039C29031
MKPSLLRIFVGASSLSAALMLAGCGEKDAGEQAPQAAPKVIVETLKAQPFTLTSQLPGRTVAYRTAEVRPQVSGILQKRLFVEGSEVKEGDQLYQIDPDLYQANFKSAEATLVSSRALANRYQKLVADKAVSRQDYDNAVAARLQAEAAYERAKIDLRYTKVLAPISGTIGRSSFTEGALLTNGQPQELAVIQQLDPIYVDVTQSVSELQRLKRDYANGYIESAGENAAQVKLQFDDGSIYEQAGRLEFSEVTVDQSTNTVTLRAVFPNPNKDLLPGMFVRANLVSGVNSTAILAPQQGITRSPKGEALAQVVNANNVVETRVLTAERTVGNKWYVTSGLQAGDRIIVKGLQFIQPGITVDPSEASQEAPSQAPSAQ